MYLYDRINDNIIVYKIQPNKEKIYKFRITEMESIPQSKRILAATTFHNYVLSNLYNKNCFFESELNKNSKFLKRNYHKLDYLLYTNYSKDLETTQEILTRYYNDELNIKMPIKVLDLNETKTEYIEKRHLLLTEKKYIEKSNKEKIMNNIISLTKDLYLLELLINELLDKLNDENLKKQIELFDINHEPIVSFKISDIGSAIDYRLGFNEKEMNEKINDSQKVLRYIK